MTLTRDASPLTGDPVEASVSLAAGAAVPEVGRATNAAAPALSESEIKSAVSRISAPEVVAITGTGKVTGTVRDADGSPVGDVLLVARESNPTPRTGRDASEVGAAAPSDESLDSALRTAAKKWAEARSGRYQARSSADGSYELAGLPEGSYSVTGYKEGWTIQGRTGSLATTGESLHFTAREVSNFELDVRLPDGSAPAEATVQLAGDWLKWTPSAPTLRTTLKRASVTVYAEVLPFQVDSGLASRFSSDEELVELEGASTVVRVTLRERNGIMGRASDPWRPGAFVLVKLLRCTDNAPYDEKALATSATEFRGQSGRFAFLDLPPGTYDIGAIGSGKSVLAHERVEVGASLSTVDLVLTEPLANDHLIARCVAPDGSDPDQVTFRFRNKNPQGGESSGSTQAKRALDGSWWLAWSDLGFSSADWPAETEFSLTAQSPEYGIRQVDLRPGQRDVLFEFEEPVELLVVLSGYGDSPDSAKLGIRVLAGSGNDAVVASASSQTGTRSYGRMQSERRISAEGEARFRNLTRGEYRVRLVSAQDWNESTLAEVTVALDAATKTVTLEIPRLYDLLVHAPNMSVGGNLWLSRKRNEQSGEAFDDSDYYGRWLQLDKDLRGAFRGLTAGEYQVNGQNGESVTATVPGGELLFDPKRQDCLRVSISREDGVLYLAGFRVGDVVVEVDGEDLAKADNLWSYWGKLTKSEVTFTILRNGARQTLRLGPVDMGNGVTDVLGGGFNPDFR